MGCLTLPLQGELDFSRCQRWNNGRERYRPAGELFDPRYAHVELIDAATAKSFVVRHHYSRSFVASRCNVGIFLREPFHAEELAGVASFSVPMTNSVIPAYFEDLLPHQGVELGRLVLLDKLAANAETWFLRRSMKALRAKLPEVRGIVSYCDPEPRSNADGEIVHKGHLGTIYRAHNGIARGRSRARTLLLTPDGRVANERSLSKLRNQERGADGVERELSRQGAPQRAFLESGADYVRRLVSEGFLRPLRHPGNFVFTWRLK